MEVNESGLIYNLHLLSLMHVFTFKQLHSATGGFSKSNVVGHGGFGLVYRGLLNNGRKVAIKFIDNAGNQGEEEFKMEVELLSRLRSPYLLSLLGYCSDNSHKLLVYEYMPNGCLQQHLFQRPPGPIPWSMLGLEVYTGAIDNFGFEDYLNGSMMLLVSQAPSICTGGVSSSHHKKFENSLSTEEEDLVPTKGSS
ncbi:hypothetical protein Bca52824_072819 [Brassica carinata]|uniref:Protein kinase domain-containing protein n=1 Tax=Brassica carinata TaxID=52824 RepID=A0A8X7U4A2_BRACI|nr:hypothetical protein Bca52824_072819 [Brassica carinata]